MSLAGVLVSSEVPGYAAASVEHDPEDDSIEQDLQSCLGIKGQPFVDRDYGVAFHKGDTEIDTSSAVAGSPAMARAVAAAGAKQAACFQNQFTAELEKSGVSVVQMSIAPVSVKVDDADEALAFRVVATAAGPGGWESIDACSVDAVSGRTETTVTESVTRGHAPTLTAVSRLAGLAVAQIRAVGRST